MASSNPPRPTSRRPVLLAVTVGAGVALAAIGIVVSIIAVPLFALARFAEPGLGLGRPVIRDGLVRVALPAGLALGILTGALVSRWYRKGGHLPREWE